MIIKRVYIERIEGERSVLVVFVIYRRVRSVSWRLAVDLAFGRCLELLPIVVLVLQAVEIVVDALLELLADYHVGGDEVAGEEDEEEHAQNRHLPLVAKVLLRQFE